MSASHPPIDDRVRGLLERMTLREKLGQLSQYFSGRTHAEVGVEKYFSAARAGEVGSFIWALPDPAMRNRLQREAVEGSRLGIPILFGMDIIHGARTAFPISLGLSCAFEPELFEKAQAVAARESAAEGIDWVFAPMCDLARDPRWGRVAETCGEDPYLSALCNAAQVRGFQGSDPAGPDRVAACLKHYVGYSAVTGGRDYNDAEVTEWTLQNAHLPPFRAGIAEGALTVMSGFHATGGLPAVADRRALTDILRDTLRFSGFVVSDWNAVQETVTWGFAGDRAEAARMAIEAGNEMDMLSGCYLETLEAEVSAGRLPVEVVDQAVRRVLHVKFAVGLFERPYIGESLQPASGPGSDEVALARECVRKSAVLLMNDGVLPLRSDPGRIAVIGPFADDRREMLGCWNAFGRAEDVATLADALKERFGVAGVRVVKGCSSHVQPRTKTLQDGRVVREEGVPEDADWEPEAAVSAAREAEVVILALGEPRGWTGENASRAELGLTGRQQELFDAVAAAGTPVVTVVFSGRPLSLPEIWKRSAAVLYAWQPGIQAGPGIVDLLSGAASPTGRLSISVLKNVSQAPLFYNRPRTGRPGSGQYREGALEEAAFPFGHGLTYAEFAYGPVRILPATAESSAEAVATVTNCGSRAGCELAQLYISQLACREGARPRQELRGFRRIHLRGGESAEVSFPLTSLTLGYWNREGEACADAGEYEIWIAPRAHDGTPARFSFVPPGAPQPPFS